MTNRLFSGIIPYQGFPRLTRLPTGAIQETRFNDQSRRLVRTAGHTAGHSDTLSGDLVVAALLGLTTRLISRIGHDSPTPASGWHE